MSSTLILNLENIHKLNTKEDNGFIHKYLGALCVINFVYRFYIFFVDGDMHLNNTFGLFTISVHGLLSTSSLIFHIPSLRNPSKPMIYPEFRWHSILFALRSIIICFQFYFQLHYFYRIITCFVTMIFADIISYLYNVEGKNGKTMRNMPFDKNISLEKQEEITRMHSIMQIGATTYMLGDINTAFSPLLAIQLAAFLMTLVRKSIINAITWHSIYSLTLWINIFLYLNQKVEFIIIHQVMINNYIYVFFPNRVNKYIAWSINFALYHLYKNHKFDYYISSMTEPYLETIRYLRIAVISMILIKYFLKFKILFIK